MRILIFMTIMLNQQAFAASILGSSFMDIEIGDSLELTAEKLNGYRIDNHDGNTNSCFYLKPANDQPSASFMILNGFVVRIEIDSPDSQITIGNELRIGSTKQEVLSNYENAVVSPHPYAEAGEYLEIQLPNNYGLIFETSRNVVTRYRIGSYPALRYIEGCL